MDWDTKNLDFWPTQWDRYETYMAYIWGVYICINYISWISRMMGKLHEYRSSTDGLNRRFAWNQGFIVEHGRFSAKFPSNHFWEDREVVWFSMNSLEEAMTFFTMQICWFEFPWFFILRRQRLKELSGQFSSDVNHKVWWSRVRLLNIALNDMSWFTLIVGSIRVPWATHPTIGIHTYWVYKSAWRWIDDYPNLGNVPKYILLTMAHIESISTESITSHNYIHAYVYICKYLSHKYPLHIHKNTIEYLLFQRGMLVDSMMHLWGSVLLLPAADWANPPVI